MARSRIHHATREEMADFGRRTSGRDESETTALYIRLPREKMISESIEKWIDGLQIVVNKDAFIRDDEDFSDLIPYAVEHELYELWVKSKPGMNISVEKTEKALFLREKSKWNWRFEMEN